MKTPAEQRQRLRFSSALISLGLLASACASSGTDPETASADSAVTNSVAQSESGEATDSATDDTASDDTASDDTASNNTASNNTGSDSEADVESELVEDIVESTDADTEVAGSVESDGAESDAALADGPISERCSADPAVSGSRVDINSSGNRIAPGSINFTDIDEVEIELPDEGIWVTADPASGGWYVVLERGSAVRVGPDGTVTSHPNPGAVPPELNALGETQSPFRYHDLFDDPIEDSRVVVDESIAAVLSTPTNELQHGVLGDAIEAAAIEWVDTCSGERGRIDIAEPDVIEGISPMLADIDSDGQIEILVTLSNADEGARLAAFELDGTSAGMSEPIGQGNRWRNQLAAGAFGPNGEVEIIDVRTPHIGGTVQAFRQIIDDEGQPSLVQVAASDPNYTSHVIGTRNLSMGIALNVDTDSFPDVVVASADRSTIVAMTRTDDLGAALQGWNIVGERELTSELTSNIATQQTSTGRSAIALADGALLRIWN